DPEFPLRIADLIDRDNQDQPAWQKYLLSSQLDMDRLDYLRRDSPCTGAGCGDFDWDRLLDTFGGPPGNRAGRGIHPAQQSLLAIEEYIFARYYMYHNVYLHKATRGFEKLLEAMWGRARRLWEGGQDGALVPAVAAFWAAQGAGGGAHPTVRQYLAIEEFTV